MGTRTPEERHITKNEASNYGLLVQKFSKRKAILIISPMLTNSQEVEQTQKRFIAWAKKQMPNRVFVVPFEFGVFELEKFAPERVAPMMKKVRRTLSRVKFEKRVIVAATGQYGDNCVLGAYSNLLKICSQKKN